MAVSPQNSFAFAGSGIEFANEDQLQGFLALRQRLFTQQAQLQALQKNVYVKGSTTAVIPATVADGSITTAKLADGAVISQKILDATISTIKLADAAVTEAKVAVAAISNTKIADDAITSPKILAGTILAGNIAAATIQGGNIAASTITGSNIAALTITSGLIAANAIIAGKIAAGSVTAVEISVSQLSAISANMGTITAGNITVSTTGFIRGGQSAYNTGSGFWLGYDSGVYKFSVGDGSTKIMTWDGTSATIGGFDITSSQLTSTQIIIHNGGTAYIHVGNAGGQRCELNSQRFTTYDGSNMVLASLGDDGTYGGGITLRDYAGTVVFSVSSQINHLLATDHHNNAINSVSTLNATNVVVGNTVTTSDINMSGVLTIDSGSYTPFTLDNFGNNVARFSGAIRTAGNIDLNGYDLYANAVNCSPIDCTTINTNNNNITMGTGELTCAGIRYPSSANRISFYWDGTNVRTEVDGSLQGTIPNP